MSGELSAGKHKGTEAARCLMEAVAEKTVRKVTDTPSTVPQPLLVVGTLLNDYCDDLQRQELIPCIDLLVLLPYNPPRNAAEKATQRYAEYLYRVALPEWVSLLNVRVPSIPSFGALSDLLEEIEDTIVPIQGSELPERDILDEVDRLVLATIRPVNSWLERGGGEVCYKALSAALYAARAYARGTEGLATIQMTHGKLMAELIAVYKEAIKEYYNE